MSADDSGELSSGARERTPVAADRSRRPVPPSMSALRLGRRDTSSSRAGSASTAASESSNPARAPTAAQPPAPASAARERLGPTEPPLSLLRIVRDVASWAYGGVAGATLLGVFAIGLHAASVGERSFEIFAFGVLVAGCAFLLAAGVGLLFGIPRSPSTADSEPEGKSPRWDYRPNTSLEQVSDWLTKMLVGVGLTNLNNLPSGLDSLSTSLASGLPESPSASKLILAILLYFIPLGFFFGYFGTRVHLAAKFRLADLGLKERVDQRLQALERVDRDLERAGHEFEATRSLVDGEMRRLQLARKANDDIVAALYDYDGRGFDRAIELADRVIMEFGRPPEALFWIRLAAAHAQRHRYLVEQGAPQSEVQAEFDATIGALQDAVERDETEAVFWIHMLSDKDYPGKPKDEDDFEHLADTPELRELLAGSVVSRRSQRPDPSQ